MIRTVLASSAAMGLVFAPMCAQADTDSSAAVSTARTPPHAGRPQAGGNDQKIATGLLVAVVVAAGAATYGRVKAFRDTKLARSD